MVSPSKILAALFDQFVCVRVTNMRAVDLSRYAFDFDLTFALLAMDADGHVYHRFGGRDERGAGTWLSAAALVHMLEVSLLEHEARTEAVAPELPAPLHVEDIPSFQKRDRGECIHCHSVNTSLYEEQLGVGQVAPDWIWKHPSPRRIGLDLGRDDQQVVTAIDAESPAAAAGLRAGDRLIEVFGTSIASASDVMFALDRAPADACELALEFERGDASKRAVLSLPAGWKRGTPREFAWRPTKWAMTPAPGFGGPRLDAAEMKRLGLPSGAFAFRVQYLVTWGDNKRYGQAAAKAGLREGDVVVSVDGRTGFHSIDHFHAWWRLRVKFGQTITIEILRAGERRSLELTALR